MHGGGQFWVSDLATGVFTDHLHNEGGDGVGQHVLDLQNLLAVFLSHCSQLCEAGYHFGIQQVFLWAPFFAVDPGFQCQCQLFVNLIDDGVLLHSWTIWRKQGHGLEEGVLLLL